MAADRGTAEGGALGGGLWAHAEPASDPGGRQPGLRQVPGQHGPDAGRGLQLLSGQVGGDSHILFVAHGSCYIWQNNNYWIK